MTSKQIFQAIEKELAETINDKELQERYNAWKYRYDSRVEQYNKKTEELEVFRKEREVLRETILFLMRKNYQIDRKMVTDFVASEVNFDKWQRDAGFLHNEMMEAKTRMQGLEDATERKIYHYWQLMSAIGMAPKDYPAFKQKYHGKIF